MNVFECVRNNVTAKMTAEYYGIKVGRNGMTCCPFHPDRHASMKLDKRYHCFGCQADGDAVDFTAKMFGIGKYEAAIKLSKDFGLAIDDRHWDNPGKGKQRKDKGNSTQQGKKELIRSATKRFDEWESYAKKVILEYRKMLNLWKNEYAPKSQDEEWHDLFKEALQQESIIDYWLEILFYGSDAEKLFFSKLRGRR
ncbi:MAG: DNA primase [Oribacterium sp.]|nr:DNA primase [Oribacterium sp.]